MKVAVIPARGGSKRIPRKNIKLFCGKPMIAWSIEAAIASGCFDKIIVSTDDQEIADVAQEWGADVPFLRPAVLADDFAGTLPVIKHAVHEMSGLDMVAEHVCCLYATAPFVTAEALREGLRTLENTDASYAFSVTSYTFPIQRSLRLDPQGRVSMFHPEHSLTRSQDLEEAFHDAGQFYWGKCAAWLAETPIFSREAAAVVLPRYRVQDIDTQEDWLRAEWMFKAIRAAEAGV